MTKNDSLRYWERIRERAEENMVSLRREADRCERERETAHAAILAILTDQDV
jgi:hypothetical protein